MGRGATAVRVAAPQPSASAPWRHSCPRRGAAAVRVDARATRAARDKLVDSAGDKLRERDRLATSGAAPSVATTPSRPTARRRAREMAVRRLRSMSCTYQDKKT